MIVFQIAEFLATCVEALLGIAVNAKTLKGTKIEIKRSITAAAVIAFMVWMVNQIQIFSIAASFVGIVGIVTASCIIYKVKIFDSISLTVVYMLLIYVVDFFLIALLGVVMNDRKFAALVVSEFSVIRLQYVILNKVLLIAIYLVLEKKCLVKLKPPVKKIGVGVILTAFFIYNLIKITFNGITFDIFFVWSFFFLFFIAVLYLSIQIMSYIQSSAQMKMEVEKNLLLVNNYKREIQRFRNEQIFYHDLKNHFLVVENYIKSQAYDKAEKYIEELNIVKGQALNRRTGIEALDILLECKMREAEEQKIRVDITADFIELNLTEGEIIALFGNLFDNAIEACSQVQDGPRWIRIAVKKIKEMTFIKFSNCCKKPPLLKHGKFISAKRGDRLHGLGMVSVGTIVEKYEGNMEVHCDNETFTVTVSFFGPVGKSS